MSVVCLVGSKSMCEWPVGAGGVVWVVRVVRRRCRVGNGVCLTQLLVLLLKQIMVPVILLPLSLHDVARSEAEITRACLGRKAMYVKKLKPKQVQCMENIEMLKVV